MVNVMGINQHWQHCGLSRIIITMNQHLRLNHNKLGGGKAQLKTAKIRSISGDFL